MFLICYLVIAPVFSFIPTSFLHPAPSPRRITENIKRLFFSKHSSGLNISKQSSYDTPSVFDTTSRNSGQHGRSPALFILSFCRQPVLCRTPLPGKSHQQPTQPRYNPTLTPSLKRSEFPLCSDFFFYCCWTSPQLSNYFATVVSEI